MADNGICFVEASGEIDLYSAPALKRDISEAIDSGEKRIIVDLSGATFVDSTTIGLLVGAQKRLKEQGGSLGVVCPEPGVRRLFDITGAERLFELYDSREEAEGGAA